MTILTGILLLPILLYSFQVITWYIQWVKTEAFSSDGDSTKEGISLIVPFKDEAQNLPEFIQSLTKQNYEHWELILVDDHSTDDGAKLAASLLKETNIDFLIADAFGSGKKAALIHGAYHSQYSTIITTDADCTFHENWLSTMTNYFYKSKSDLLIGPVSIKKANGYIQRFQQIDFAALQITGGAAALNGKAIMCNGANLMCNREQYQIAQLKPEIASGDDMFLLEWMKRQKKKVSYLKSSSALVQTKALPSLIELLQQRARWATKAKHFSDKQILFTGFIVALTNFLIAVFLIGGFWYPVFYQLFGITFFIKSICDYMLLKAGSHDFNFRISLFELIYWQIHYPIYVLTVLLTPLFHPIKWKSRSI